MIEFHPLANIFPLIEGREFDDLVGDIRQHGLREQIVLVGSRILDGRNRYRASVAAGLLPESLDTLTVPQLKYFKHLVPAGQEAPPQEEMLAFVLSKNLHRRQLNESQRAMVAANIANMRQGERTDIEPSANLQKVTQDDAAKSVNVSTRTVADAVKVRRDAEPELRSAVEQGHIAVSVAAKAATLPPEQQREIAGKARQGDANAARNITKQGARADKEEKLGKSQRDLPKKKYGVIYADPEWRFEVYSRETGMDRAADNHYPTSSIEEIAKRPVSEIAAADCVLFLWATVPMLQQAFYVMEAWGFACIDTPRVDALIRMLLVAVEDYIADHGTPTGDAHWVNQARKLLEQRPRGKYKSHAAWIKDRVGTGYWFRNQHELLLVGTRGNVPAPAMGTQLNSTFSSAAAEHSTKPDAAYEMIERYFPNLPKIELNARRARLGWDAWGLEAPAAEAAE